MKMATPEHRYPNLGHVYRLIEQFELISRTDLAKLSGFAPASMTALTKLLIDHQFIMERTSQNLASRGRPAVGLSLSPFYWSLLCLTVSSHSLSVALCRLNGENTARREYPISSENYAQLAYFITQCLNDFMQQPQIDSPHLLAISISVLGKVDQRTGSITQLDTFPLACPLVSTLQTQFAQPILINEHFQCWFLAESTLGRLMSDEDVIYLQLDNDINLSVLLQGKLLQQNEHKRMNVDKMLMPRFALSDEMGEGFTAKEKYQLKNQVTFTPLARLIDRRLPNTFTRVQDKMAWFCQNVEQQHPHALQILSHITDNLAYMLMNLVNLFSTPKIMINSPLQRIKTVLFAQLEEKLNQHLLLDDFSVHLVASQYPWDSPLIPAATAKWALYKGELFKEIITL